MDLSIIIVNWNSKDYLRKCIESIVSTTHGIEFEIVVIDSASFDGCGKMLRQDYPQVKFIQSDRNLGFAKANNFAFKSSRGNSLLFLNPDTKLIGAAIKELYTSLNSLPDAGIVGLKILNSDLTVQTSCIQTIPTVLSRVIDCKLLRKHYPCSSMWGTAALFTKVTAAQDIEAISGACMMMKREVFKEINGFSEDYFMYAEDVDICYKAKQAGFKNYYVPTAQIIHYGGASSKETESNFSEVTMRESVWRFLRKFRGPEYASLYRTAMLVSGLSRVTVLILVLPYFLINRRMKVWMISYRKWFSIIEWALGFSQITQAYK